MRIGTKRNKQETNKTAIDLERALRSLGLRVNNNHATATCNSVQILFNYILSYYPLIQQKKKSKWSLRHANLHTMTPRSDRRVRYVGCYASTLLGYEEVYVAYQFV